MKWTSKPFHVLSVSALALMLVVSGCGSKNNNSESNSGGAAANTENAGAGSDAGKDFKIGMVTDGGGVNDKSFNQSAWEGLQQLTKDTGAEVKYLESKGESDFEPNLNQMVKAGYSLTWGIGFMMNKAITTVATQNPEAKLASIDSEVSAPNVESVMFAENEGSFLVGVVAGLTTKTNKVGFVGGVEGDLIKKFEAGFAAGVAAVNPEAKVTVQYVGDFTKPDLGKASAATLYNDGNDIIYHAAGGSGNGVFTEAKDRVSKGEKVWVIGVDKDQSVEFGNDITLTSMVKRVDQAVQIVSQALIDGDFKGGTTRTLTLKDGAVGLPENNPNVSEDIMAKVKEYEAKIVSGEVTVPAK
ncbi:BMP family ABC transporter substrate-binding protein [Paenibacillus albicereus]|uniref:BMP family ABC transporter substrate-binding protein n=1 Tax=Paenibacillus albicereus TaxID=2726185 RepID=A0A6H2GS52_9BACL|nr:BMP family ABC transporter substrate-binding protein [Paenibacillus albicereus]QJC50227.1 BMP family ABC transporter substrate-binding protein [Paenibacillus albicereus]